MIKFSEEGMSTAKTGWNLGLLHKTVSHVVHAKEKFLKESRSATPVDTIDKKANSHTSCTENVLVIWTKDQTRYSMSLSQGTRP